MRHHPACRASGCLLFQSRRQASPTGHSGQEDVPPQAGRAQGSSLSFPAPRPLPGDQQHQSRWPGTLELGALGRAAFGAGASSPGRAGVDSRRGWPLSRTMAARPLRAPGGKNSPRNSLGHWLCPEAVPHPAGTRVLGAEPHQVPAPLWCAAPVEWGGGLGWKALGQSWVVQKVPMMAPDVPVGRPGGWDPVLSWVLSGPVLSTPPR